ncbi:MFS transporter [Nonomuraea sp. NPDC050556]|uniref:MFS transporter n=1 Tax=Nonomuraea sp. NPDC050556 TaxID=3364369 RepID=UPI0037932999
MTVLAPARLPSAFHRLWAASAVSSLGDGIYLAALPLLAVNLTASPIVLSLITAAATLPWLLFGLLGGALVDRWDRRRTMWITDLARAALVAIPVVAAMTGSISMPLLIAVAFLLGIGQLFFDTAAQSYLPQLVGRDPALLQRANSRMHGAGLVGHDFAGPPAGSALFALARAVPFAVDAVSFLFSALLIRSLPAERGPAAPARTTSLVADMREGVRYLLGHRVLLGLSLRPAVGNLAFSAGGAVLVLFATKQLGLGTFGFGLLLTVMSIGGLTGTVAARHLGGRLGTGTALTVTAAIEAASQLWLGLSHSPVSAGLAMAVCGGAMSATMVLGPSVRQAIVPQELAGRVGAAGRILAVVAAPVGAVLGGWLAQEVGLAAPYLFGAAVLLIMTLVTMRMTSNSRIEEALEEGARP